MMEARQLHPLFAGEVSGVDLAGALAPQTVRALKDAIDRYAVLVFHDQALDDDRLLGLGQLFGPVEPPRNHRVVRRLKHAELADISNLDANNQLRSRDDHRRLDGRATASGIRMPRSGRCRARCRCCLRTSCRPSAARPSSPISGPPTTPCPRR